MFTPSPWSMYSKCPQVGKPCLQPPPTPKFLVAVEEDEAAAGQEVALPGKRGAAYEQQRQRRQLSCNFTHFYSSISAEHSMYCSRSKDFLLKKLLMALPARVTEFPRPRTRPPHRPRQKPWREGHSPSCWPAKQPAR